MKKYFTKTWTVFNSSNFDWPRGGKVALVCTDIDSPFSAYSKPIMKRVKQGHSVKLQAVLPVPKDLGQFKINFTLRLTKDDGEKVMTKERLTVNLKTLERPNNGRNFFTLVQDFKNPQDMNELASKRMPIKFSGENPQSRRESISMQSQLSQSNVFQLDASKSIIDKLPEGAKFNVPPEEEKEVAVEYEEDVDKECPSVISYNTGINVVAPDPKDFNTIYLSSNKMPVQP